MMERLVERGMAIARDAERRTVERVAAQLRAIPGTASVETTEGSVVVRGRGLLKRWLADAGLRFLGGGLK